MRQTLIAVLLLSSPVLSEVEAQSFDPDEIRAASITPEYFTLDPASAKIELLGDAELPAPKPVEPGQGVAGPQPPADTVGEIGAIINIGQKIWSIIVANKPVVDVQTSYAAAMPKGITAADQLSGWKAPQATVYSLKVKNVYGMEVVNLRYLVLRTTGGSYKGKGRFLTAVTVQPMDVDVLWGYRFTVTAGAKSVTNAGTAADPIGAIMLVVDWKIETPLKESRGAGVYYVQGDGVFKDLDRTLKAHTLVGPLRRPDWDQRL